MNESNQVRPQAQTAPMLLLAVVPLGITLNLALGTLVQVLKLPVYLDAVGTVAITLLVGWRVGMVVGVGSFLVGGLLVNPLLPWFAGTQAAIAAYTGFVASRGGFRTFLRTGIAGIGLGIVAGVLSAPVIVYLFGGLDASGRSVLTAFLLASGKKVLESVVLSGLASEPLDKCIQCLLAVWLLRGLPPSILSHFQSRLLERNGLA